MKVFAVKRLSQKSATISLPNGLIAFVAAYNDALAVGQYVRGVVTSLDAGRHSRIELSLRPSEVNSGVSEAGLRAQKCLSAEVKTREDHGFVMDMGVEGFKGFLPFESADKKATLREGMLIDVVVEKLDKRTRVTTTKNVESSCFLMRTATVWRCTVSCLELW